MHGNTRKNHQLIQFLGFHFFVFFCFGVCLCVYVCFTAFAFEFAASFSYISSCQDLIPWFAMSADLRSLAKEAFIYGWPICANYNTLYAYSIDVENPDYKAPLNQISNTARAFTPEDKVRDFLVHRKKKQCVCDLGTCPYCSGGNSLEVTISII